MFPFTGLRLLAPAILPSWRFFDAVTASPRVDYALLPAPDADAVWREFRPRVAVLTPAMMVRRLFWNPEWNESLYLVSLAERLMSDAGPATAAHSERELLRRIGRHLDREDPAHRSGWLQIRLRFVHRLAGGGVTEDILYVSAPHAIAGLVEP